MIGPGLQYYLRRDMPPGVPVPRELFVTRTVPPPSQIRPAACPRPAACLGDEPRIWIVGSGRLKDPYQAVTAGQEAVLRRTNRLGLTRHFLGLILALLEPGPR